MKRERILIGMLVCIALTLVACGGGASTPAAPTEAAPVEPTTAPDVSDNTSNPAPVPDACSLLTVADVERTIIRYRELPRLFADLRALGETNVLTGRRTSFLSRRTLRRLASEYRERFSGAEGRYIATFEIVYLTGWAPHESQQQSLKPGSAKMRLAGALGPKKHEAG